MVCTDGTVLHSICDWDDVDLGSVGLGGEGDWSALVSLGTGGLLNGLLVDLLDVGTGDLFILDWMVRSPATPIPWKSPAGPVYRLGSQINMSEGRSNNLDWVMDKEIAYLRYSGRYDSISLVFTDDSLIWARGPSYLGVSNTGWRRGLGADWQALVIMGASAMGSNRRVNLLLDGYDVVSWTLH